MQNRIHEILGHLLSHFQQKKGTSSLGKISSRLESRGYSTNEISEALSLFCSRFQVELERFPQNLVLPATLPMRIRNQMECEVVSGEAYAYLLQLFHLGLICADEFERIIERTLMLGGSSLGRDEIRSVAASVIFSEDAEGAGLVQRDGRSGMIH